MLTRLSAFAVLALPFCAVAQQYGKLYDFGTGTNGGIDGHNPEAALVAGPGGVLYGTTIGGGTYNFGTVFSLSPPQQPGESWTETILYSFAGGADGEIPTGLILANGSNGLVIYGTTEFGGIYGGPACSSTPCGAVFELTPPAGAGSWTKTEIYNFMGGSGGSSPLGPLAIGSGVGGATVLYGTTVAGGTAHGEACEPVGCGTVYSLTAPSSPGSLWTEDLLYVFAANEDGTGPQAGVVIGHNGVLYGAAMEGGKGVCGSCGGIVFALHPPASSGGPWQKQTLHVFQGSPDGEWPNAPLSIAPNGTIYGTTQYGGDYKHCVTTCGTVFSITPPSSPGGEWAEKVLYSFPNTLYRDYNPVVILGADGILYGTTDIGGDTSSSACAPDGCGTIFSLAPPAAAGGAWTHQALHSFAGAPNDGNEPRASLTTGANGILYGTTLSGGSSNDGTVFAVKP
jgi:uncharacterized repeat protein (TIGR03803 family)